MKYLGVTTDRSPGTPDGTVEIALVTTIRAPGCSTATSWSIRRVA